VRIHSALTADLALLTEALDIPATDIAATLDVLASDAAAAVTSYVGLSVRVCTEDAHVELTTLDDVDQVAAIATSLRIPITSPGPGSASAGTRIVLILYAGAAGAFVDLAADLAWLTGSTSDDVHLDQDLAAGTHRHPPQSLRSISTINQAIGVLIGRGRTPEGARAELDQLAAASDVAREVAAGTVLASVLRTTGADDG
jgi:hypothetical protein